MLEKILQFGESSQLVGVLSTPPTPDPSKPAVIILNSGALHRVGGCRMSVLLARLLSDQGYNVLRFDFYGIGDSGFGSEASDNPLKARPEIRAAMDVLSSKTDCTRFVLHGLCSGARDALAAALVDDRIIGLSMIDGYAFRTTRYHLNKLAVFVCDPKAWINFIRVRIPSYSKTGKAGLASEILELPFWPDYPPKPDVETAFRALNDRGVKMLATFTGSWANEYNYEGQLLDMFPKIDFGDSVTENYVPDANHVMTDLADQKNLRETVLSFIHSLQ